MRWAKSWVSSATDSSPAKYIVDVSKVHGDAPRRFAAFRRTVAYIRFNSGNTYKWVSSKTANVSFPPSFDAFPEVEGRISPPPGRNVRVSPAASDGNPSPNGPSV